MAKTAYPTGVENHGGSLRIWFIYKGCRVRESLGVPDTPKNRKLAGELRSSVCFSIKTGSFNYAEKFPSSPNLKKFGAETKEITVFELANKWLELKKMEITTNAFGRYKSIVRNMIPRIGESRLASSVTKEDLLFIRKELLTGFQLLGYRKKSVVKGRSVPTVNSYMTVAAMMFQFAADSGYIPANPFSGISPLKKSKAEPDPLARDEFVRMIEAMKHQQIKNMWSLAVYTGVRHGELVSLAWEDIDLKAGTMIIRRNLTSQKEFTLPKTDAGTDRVINLISPAVDILKNQAEMTRLGKQYQIEVKLREYGRSEMHPCTFVFNPQIVTRNGLAGHHYAVSSIGQMWDTAIRRSGIRHRKAYQSRHTYACWSLAAGANPNFIAKQMGHADSQMVYRVYGSWMAENNQEQVTMLNQKLSDFAPPMPHAIGSN
ncbi:site-specific integrase [Klebsiella aerogenes]|uniref:site-specific integrase n=1 Tax=Klebsiella aerogenes TaxID=548 RepID=UPI00254C2D70|nr:site-specific integrase [Klebsiella aerogenes]MDK7097047.1 site-specific integrase [Klebsiella aerogenes]MDK7642481.1 site-specific integrase [Klebsiella aerogenes]MDK7847256.1 site-specific integrase [Klebsiella aerogenes]MDK8313513.1 site-specific integrase [Klebsiella aerogenes]